MRRQPLGLLLDMEEDDDATDLLNMLHIPHANQNGSLGIQVTVPPLGAPLLRTRTRTRPGSISPSLMAKAGRGR